MKRKAPSFASSRSPCVTFFRISEHGSWQTGFTLIEVLVALFVTGVVLLAGMRALGVVTQASDALGPRLAAQWSADNVQAGLRLDGVWPDVGDSSFDCSQGAYRFICHQHVSPTPNPAFRRVDVQVTTDQDSQVLAQTVNLVTNTAGFVL